MGSPIYFCCQPLLFILLVQINFPLQPNIFKSYQNVFSWYHLLQARMLSYKLTGAKEEASHSWRVIAWTVLLRDSKHPVSEHWCSWPPNKGTGHKIKPVRGDKQEAVFIFSDSIQLLYWPGIFFFKFHLLINVCSQSFGSSIFLFTFIQHRLQICPSLDPVY